MKNCFLDINCSFLCYNYKINLIMEDDGLDVR